MRAIEACDDVEGGGDATKALRVANRPRRGPLEALLVRRYNPVDFSGAYDGYENDENRPKPLIDEADVPLLAYAVTCAFVLYAGSGGKF